MFQYPDKARVVKEGGNTATFEISPLYPGYGATIGNVLRRTLISSLEGAAVTAVKIKGVDHEFTTIPGVLEDVIAVILNLKNVRFRLFKDEAAELTLKVKGLKKVTAGDIKTSSDVEIVNPDQVIATITDKKTELEMTIVVERGIGYIPVEQRQKEKLTVGEIAIDGIFTPVRNVNFRVENIRVGTCFQLLVFFIYETKLFKPRYMFFVQVNSVRAYGLHGFFKLLGRNSRSAYTRDGSFKVDRDGNLVNANGLKLADNITVPQDTSALTVSIPRGQTTVHVGLEGTAVQPNGAYQVLVTPNFNAGGSWVTKKGRDGFDLHVERAPEQNGAAADVLVQRKPVRSQFSGERKFEDD